MNAAPYALALVALVVQILSKAPVAAAMKRAAGRYDNNNPREQQALLDARGKRALAAHNNGYEALPPFLAGVVAAVQAGASPVVTTALCAAFVLARVIYVPLYVNDIATARSAIWSVGFLSSLALWGVAAAAKFGGAG